MEYHLLKDNGEWQLRKEGSKKAIIAAQTKAEAIDKMRDYMESKDGSVAIHSINGEIQEHRAYSPDEDSGRMVSKKTLGIAGVVAVAAITAACVVYYYRDVIPVKRLRRMARF
jgi:hypothetical protein